MNFMKIVAGVFLFFQSIMIFASERPLINITHVKEGVAAGLIGAIYVDAASRILQCDNESHDCLFLPIASTVIAAGVASVPLVSRLRSYYADSERDEFYESVRFPVFSLTGISLYGMKYMISPLFYYSLVSLAAIEALI